MARATRLKRVCSMACVVALSTSLAACSMRLTHYDRYHGDGIFEVVRAPSGICQDGYRVDFGSIDLAQTSGHEFRIDGLPSIESTIGVSLSASNGDTHRPTALITVTLRDETGHIVLSRHEKLSEWVRSFAEGDESHAYLYQRGTTIEVGVAPGVVHVERFPIGQDDSWGTYFTPRRNARYTLHFAVDEPDADEASLDAHLQIRAVVGCL